MPRLYHLVQRSPRWGANEVSTEVPAGVPAFHDAIASLNAKLVAVTGLVASPTMKASPRPAAVAGSSRSEPSGSQDHPGAIPRREAPVGGAPAEKRGLVGTAAA